MLSSDDVFVYAQLEIRVAKIQYLDEDSPLQ